MSTLGYQILLQGSEPLPCEPNGRRAHAIGRRLAASTGRTVFVTDLERVASADADERRAARTTYEPVAGSGRVNALGVGLRA